MTAHAQVGRNGISADSASPEAEATAAPNTNASRNR